MDGWGEFEDYLASQPDFSGAVLVAKDGRPVVSQAYGLADRKVGRPNDIDTRFNLASVSKMFTGVAIAQLVEAGKLSFSDTVGRHLSGFAPEVADHVTVDQLLTHTSGLGDFAAGGFPELAKRAKTATELLPLIRGERLQFRPGERESYSNSGYVVLGAILEAVSGESYYDYVRAHILRPAGMKRTDWIRPGTAAGNTAKGYMTRRDPGSTPAAGNGSASGPRQTLPPPGQGTGPAGTVTLPPPTGSNGGDGRGGDSTTGDELVEHSDVVPWGNPSGGAYSTVGDLLRFSQALIGHTLLSPTMTETVMRGKVPMSSGGAKVAYGFTDGEVNGVRIVGHGGGVPGVAATIDIYPTKRYVVVILANVENVSEPIHETTRTLLTS